MTYVKEVFDVTNIDHAKHVVLTTDPNDPGKFQRETDFICNIINQEIDVQPGSSILDFGCGMGRISKKLLDMFDCTVVGVDISDSMLLFARLYTGDLRFTAQKDITQTDCFDIALSVLVLQHTEDPASEIKKIYNSLKPDGYFILVNENTRYVPSAVDKQGFIIWNDDEFNVFTETEKYMDKVKAIPYLNTDKYVNIYRKSK